MKSASTGTPAASRSGLDDRNAEQAGFTLLEALVSLALILAFAGVLGPNLSQTRRIMADADGRLAAQVLLRSLLDAPFDRTALVDAARQGEIGAMRWRIVAAPVPLAGTSGGANWSAFHLTASVAWAPGQVVSAETIRLGKPQP